MIRIENLSKTFKVYEKDPGFWGSVKTLVKKKWITKNALQNINLTINQGEIIGLIGANGAGKTTLIKILAGIIHPSAGEVSVLGYVPSERDNQLRRQMSLIMGQKAQLWWDLPAMDCFLLLQQIYQIPDNEFKTDLEYLSEALQIKSQLKIQVRSLSLGERMKVELMAALLHRPKLIYLDEPTIGLDISSQKAIRRFIKEYHQSYHPIVILTSHYMEDIEELCERVVIVKEGQKVFDGKLSFIQRKYSPEKIITLRTKEKIDDKVLSEVKKLPAELLENNEDTLKVKVTQEHVPDVSAKLLNLVTVLDLAIEGQDISDTIEKIMKEGFNS